MLVFDEETGRWRIDPSTGIRLPQSVRDVIERRVQRIGDEVRALLVPAAVIGNSFDVGLLSEESKRDANRAKHALQVLADASGASASFPKELADVDRITVGIANEIRSQYIIEYNPVNQNFDGGFRPVRVAVNAPGKPAVRTRTGYYATPDAPPKPSKSAQVIAR